MLTYLSPQNTAEIITLKHEKQVQQLPLVHVKTVHQFILSLPNIIGCSCFILFIVTFNNYF